MTLHDLQRGKIIASLIEFRKKFDGSQEAFAKMMGLNASAYSQLVKAVKNNQPLERIIKDDKLATIGRKLNVNFRNEAPWNLGRSETFEYITTVLARCKQLSVGRVFCDIADIGKTTAAKHFMLTEPNVFYVDCSQCPEKGDFIRAMAKAVGVSPTGSTKDVYKDTVYMIQSMDHPMFIIDEWGDLTYPAFLATKSYLIALEHVCGFLMMGADGLRHKIQRGLDRKCVGFAEIFRRLGGEFMSITGSMNPAEVVMFKKRQIETVAMCNVTDNEMLKEVIKNTQSLTRVRENVKKVSNPPKLDSSNNDENQAAA